MSKKLAPWDEQENGFEKMVARQDTVYTNANRLSHWEIQANQYNQLATLLITVGHGPQKGKVMVHFPTDLLTKQKAIALLEGVIAGIKNGVVFINEQGL